MDSVKCLWIHFCLSIWIIIRFNKRFLIYSSSGEDCALGIQAGSRSNVTGESNSEIISTLLLIAFLQLFLAVCASCLFRIPTLLCAEL